MTSSVDRIIGAPIKALKSAAYGVFGLAGDGQSPAASSPAPEPAAVTAPVAAPTVSAPVASAVADLTPDAPAAQNSFATRAQQIQQRAAGAGAARSGNEADMLGYVTPKKRGVARTLLG